MKEKGDSRYKRFIETAFREASRVLRQYDSEENHRFAHKEICANSVIPLRYEVPLCRTTGFYRRKLRRNFPYDIYHQRSKVETVNSVQKRKFGDELHSRLLKMQRREMKVIDVVYNIHRYINYFVSVFLGFLQSLTFCFFHPKRLHTLNQVFYYPAPHLDFLLGFYHCS